MSIKNISVITATYNAEAVISDLIESIKAQTDNAFSWILVDSNSTDNTIRLIESSDLDNVTIISEPDFGVYDALNKGIDVCRTDYYLVVGADDILSPTAIENYKSAIVNGNMPDFIAASWITDGKLCLPRKGKSWIKGMSAVASCHSVALLIKKSLHSSVGYYSPKLPICADQLFVKRAMNEGASIYVADFVAGNYSSSGMSGTQTLHYLVDFYKSQIISGENKYVQTFLFFLRLLKHIRKI
ncbi:glycosyltransferase [Marinobacterium lacunae]|uniref:glycosyltransferase n=1 Tax=Marinobacterium lacunae TaxID=1232683 RepID=UPI00068D2A2C|nr:glycosyltransferase [Marinobacterium lacunae]